MKRSISTIKARSPKTRISLSPPYFTKVPQKRRKDSAEIYIRIRIRTNRKDTREQRTETRRNENRNSYKKGLPIDATTHLRHQIHPGIMHARLRRDIPRISLVPVHPIYLPRHHLSLIRHVMILVVAHRAHAIGPRACWPSRVRWVA